MKTSSNLLLQYQNVSVLIGCGFIYKERDTYFVQGIVTSSCSIESVLENYKYGYFSVHIAVRCYIYLTWIINIKSSEILLPFFAFLKSISFFFLYRSNQEN